MSQQDKVGTASEPQFIDPGTCSTCPCGHFPNNSKEGICTMNPPTVSHMMIQVPDPGSILGSQPRLKPERVPLTGPPQTHRANWCWHHPARAKEMREMYNAGRVLPSPYTMHMFSKGNEKSN